MNKYYSSDLDPLLETIIFQGRQVVDVGCGNGVKARALVKSGARVIGIEPDLESWEVDETEGEGYKLMRAGAENMPVEDDFADIVIFMFSLHHVPTELMGEALDEAYRVLKNTGVIYIAEPIARGGFQDVCKYFLDETQIRKQAIEAVEKHLKPFYEHCNEFEYVVARYFDNFDQFVSEMVGHALNRYDRTDVDTPVVRERFNEYLTEGRYQLDHPARVWILYNSSENLIGDG